MNQAMGSLRFILVTLMVSLHVPSLFAAVIPCDLIWPETVLWVDGAPGATNKITRTRPDHKNVSFYPAIEDNWVLRFSRQVSQHIRFDQLPQSGQSNDHVITVEALIRTSTSHRMLGLLSQSFSNGFGYSLVLADGMPVVIGYDAATEMFKTIPVGGDLRDGRFHHVAVGLRFAGADLQIDPTIDGVSMGTVILTNAAFQTPGPSSVTIGQDHFQPLDSGFEGEMDEVLLHLRRLEPATLSNIANRGLAPRCEVPTCHPADLLALWRGEGNADDMLGFAHGTNVNTEFATGILGRSFRFTSRDQYIEAPNRPELNFPGGKFTIEAWVKPFHSGLSGEYFPIVDKRTVSGDRATGYVLVLYANGVTFQFSDDDWRSPATTWHFNRPGLSDGNFHHIAVTVNRHTPNGGALYVDGQLVGRFDPQVEPFSIANNSTLRIGRVVPNTTPFQFLGDIDEVAIHANTLSPDQIAEIYSSRGQCGLFPSDADGDGLPDAWELEHGFSPDDPTDADLDFDGDGTSNLREYYFGTNPADRAFGFSLRISYFSRDGASEVRVRAVVGKRYRLQHAGEPGGSWETIEEVVADQGTLVFELPRPNGRAGYYRVILSEAQPPAP